MDENEKQSYLENYKKEKEKGVPFFPDIIFKDAIVSFVIFLILIGLAYFLGAPLDARADPADTTYTPRPEWYFLFLFQLLKYFPGKLEVVGVVLIPTLVIILLLLLPFLDRSRFRYFLNRPFVVGPVALGVIGVIVLTGLAVREAPPPLQTFGGDETAKLYTDNCSGCHGPVINVPVGTNLHEVISQGRHEGMPAWNADLSTDQIDALAGFILSPAGSALFTQNCGACHEAPELVSEDPTELKNALEQGTNYAPHADQDVPQWTAVLGQAERTALLNFLVAPDGQRLFAVNCSPCHGNSVAVTGDEAALREIISKGGMHLEMPAWRGKLSEADLETLAHYIVDPLNTPEGLDLFAANCVQCHGSKLPQADNYEDAYNQIASGGAHQTMPVWGDVLTSAQLDALVTYTLQSAEGNTAVQGQQLFEQNCVGCHGKYGEGGPNPTRPDDIIAPISSAEYLQTRDDLTLRNIITQGQPDFGMSPFGTTAGGPLDEDQVDAIVAYIRSWEANPPVELPPEVRSVNTVSLSGPEIYASICAQCHGENATGKIGPSLRSTEFRQRNTNQDIFNTINLGHEATAMIAWGEVLTSDQITQLVDFITSLPITDETSLQGPSFAAEVQPVFQTYCQICHSGSEPAGGWDATSYDSVMNTGDNSPVVIPGDAVNSLLAMKILGTQEEGDIMPPKVVLPQDLLQIILDWISAGALNN